MGAILCRTLRKLKYRNFVLRLFSGCICLLEETDISIAKTAFEID